ncbi:hypothetical protein YC2023_112100 [Brassica napus]
MGLLKLKHMGLTWLIWDINLNGLAVKALKDIKGLVGWRVVLCTHGSEIILAASGGTRYLNNNYFTGGLPNKLANLTNLEILLISRRERVQNGCEGDWHT